MGPLPNSPLPWLKAMPARPLPPTPSPEEHEGSECGSQCPSQCSCDSIEKKSLSDFDEDEPLSDGDELYARDVETQTDPESGMPTARRTMPRDTSSDSLGEAKNKIIKLKNINDLLRQIDEQFNNVLRQTTAAAADLSSPLSEIDGESSIMSSPEPLPSPSCIVSPISQLADDSTLPMRRGIGLTDMDPLNIIMARRASTPKHASPNNSQQSLHGQPVGQPMSHPLSQPLSVSTDMAVPYRGASNSPPIPGTGSPAHLSPAHRSPGSPALHSPASSIRHRIPLQPRGAVSRLPIRHPARPADTRLTHPLLDGYPYRRRSPSQENGGSEGYHSDRPETDDAVIVREIPPSSLQFTTKQRSSAEVSSPENVNV